MKTIFVCFITALLVGCSTVGFTPSTNQVFPTFHGIVAVLDSTPQGYTDVGWISCESTNNFPVTALIDMAKSKASEKGANAIVFNGDSLKKAYARNTIVCRAIIYER